MSTNIKKGLGDYFRDNLGRIKVDGDRLTAQFWIRVLKLEEYIAFVQSKLYERPEPIATSPIISEFQVDDHFELLFALSFTVDAIEATKVVGMVYYCSPENRATALEHRNKLGDAMIETLGERMVCLEKEMETFMAPPQAEGDLENRRAPETSRPDPADG